MSQIELVNGVVLIRDRAPLELLPERLYSFEAAAELTGTSVQLLEHYAGLGLIEPTRSLLKSRDVARVAQIQRLRRDLGVNLVGAAIALDMAQEIARLRAQLQLYRAMHQA
jgi:DNA-binding transcriptional MerR regulator